MTAIRPKSESLPLEPVACNVHPWMNAYVLIARQPLHGTVSGEDGKLRDQANVPAGKQLDFAFVAREGQGQPEGPAKSAKTRPIARASLAIEVPAGETVANDLGEHRRSTPAMLGK